MGRTETTARGLPAALVGRTAGKRRRLLGGGQRAQEHALVQVAEMADAEVFAGVAAEARAIRNVEGVEGEVAERVGVVALGQQHRGDRRRIIYCVATHDLELPGAHRASSRLG